MKTAPADYVGTRARIRRASATTGTGKSGCERLDLEQGRLTGGECEDLKGAMNGVIWPEGPHLYRKDGYYYLMIAEGGTGPAPFCDSGEKQGDLRTL